MFLWRLFWADRWQPHDAHTQSPHSIGTDRGAECPDIRAIAVGVVGLHFRLARELANGSLGDDRCSLLCRCLYDPAQTQYSTQHPDRGWRRRNARTRRMGSGYSQLGITTVYFVRTYLLLDSAPY